MKRLLLPLTILFALSVSVAHATTKTITLQDGSTINGDVMLMEHGTYTIKTKTMGEVKVSAANIATISDDTFGESKIIPAKKNKSNIASLPEFQAMQNKISSNPDIIADIQKLMEDPEIMQILSDPSFIAALQSGNVNALKSDARINHLANNPKMQALMNKVQNSN
ncbi:MAG: hypothetical protein V2A70_06845 [Candidatus Omnitrophota bacterium]